MFGDTSLAQQQGYLRTYVLGRIRSLQTVDSQAVTEEEASRAVRNVVASHLTLSTLLSHAYTDVSPLPSLSVSPIAQTLHSHHPRPCSLHFTTAPSTEWYHKVSPAHVRMYARVAYD